MINNPKFPICVSHIYYIVCIINCQTDSIFSLETDLLHSYVNEYPALFIKKR